ncbi:response regulator [Paenibacillus daejeonensis]|uniref:response regulator n=1 Tax=Paenibacillus daejeonensis TaxID=135193 RepID=UPI0003626D30|nr:response regulator [Paenibacillus daejeonensis]
MHTLLIVDDQPDLVEDLATMLPWSTVGVGTVHKAFSAREALDIVSDRPIDLVITDIRMPGMSGLELLEQLRVSWKHIKCIVLTGYDDFAYAKEALQHQAVDYLLKPASDEEVLQAAAKAVRALEEQWSTISSHQNIMQSVQLNLSVLQAALLTELMQGRRIPEEELAARLTLLELPLCPDQPFRLMLIRLEEGLDRYGGQDIGLMEFAVANIAEEIFAEQYHLWKTKDEYNYLVAILTLKTVDTAGVRNELAEQMAAQLQHAVKLYLKGTVSILLSHWGVLATDMAQVHSDSVVQFRQHIGFERELLLSLGEEHAPVQASSLSLLYDPPTLNHLLEAGQWEQLERKLDDVFEELEQQWGHSHEHILETYYTIASSLTRSIHKSKRWMSELLGDNYQHLVGSPQFHTIAQLRDWTTAMIGKFRQAVELETIDTRSSTVRQAQQYILAHLGEASLQSIAAHVYLNPSYLSKIYKLETGEGISDYLFRLKMEQAARQLTTTHQKIYEIAAGLGYLKTSYFIKVFKEKYGLTPQEYREKLQ